MSVVHRNVALIVHQARDRARAILTELEGLGHLQTAQSNSLFLALASIEKRLLTVDPPPRPVAEFVSDLEHLVRECNGRLEPVKPLVENALALARKK